MQVVLLDEPECDLTKLCHSQATAPLTTLRNAHLRMNVGIQLSGIPVLVHSDQARDKLVPCEAYLPMPVEIDGLFRELHQSGYESVAIHHINTVFCMGATHELAVECRDVAIEWVAYNVDDLSIDPRWEPDGHCRKARSPPRRILSIVCVVVGDRERLPIDSSVKPMEKACCSCLLKCTDGKSPSPVCAQHKDGVRASRAGRTTCTSAGLTMVFAASSPHLGMWTTFNVARAR